MIEHFSFYRDVYEIEVIVWEKMLQRISFTRQIRIFVNSVFTHYFGVYKTRDHDTSKTCPSTSDWLTIYFFRLRC